MEGWLDQEDVEQIKDIAAWRASQSFDPTKGWTEKQWVGFKAHRAGIDALRKASQRRRLVPIREIPLSEFSAVTQDETDLVDAQLLIQAVLSRLHPRESSLLEATVMGDQTLRDWAKENGVSEKTAWGWKLRALDRLSYSPEIQALINL